MAPWDGLWSAFSHSTHRGGGQGDEHAVPLLPNQESGASLKRDDVNSNTRAGWLSDILHFSTFHKGRLIAIVLSTIFGLVFLKLAFGPSTTTTDSRPIPTIKNLTATYFADLGARRLRVSYGPYHVPPSSVKNGMASFFNKNSTKPCEDCLITFIQAGLEYPDGTYANADTGLWLHHVVQMDTATDDAVCGKAVTNGTLSPNRFFASGNERSPVQLCADGTERTGYFLAKNSTLITSVEFMNETPRPLTGILTIDYEFIPANPFPASFQKLSSVWLDVGGCENSDVPVPSNTTFTLDTPANWVFGQSDSRIVFAAGHLHDGGTHIEIQRNGNTICDSAATYGATQGYVEHESGMEHISSMTTCGSNLSRTGDNVLRANDALSIHAHYDMRKHTGMTEADGSVADVMGIAIMYFASSVMGEAGVGKG